MYIYTYSKGFNLGSFLFRMGGFVLTQHQIYNRVIYSLARVHIIHIYIYKHFISSYIYLCMLCCVSCLPSPHTSIHKGIHSSGSGTEGTRLTVVEAAEGRLRYGWVCGDLGGS